MQREDAAPIVVVGALNLDVCGLPAQALRMRDSNPGEVRMAAGGVGHNIARQLAAMGHAVELVSLLGDDDAAGLLARFSSEEGISLRHAQQVHGPSPVYLCVQDADGDMAVAVNAMSLLAQFTPDLLAQALGVINAAPVAVVDANLPQETIEALADAATVPLLLDPVSGFKAVRAQAVLGRFAAIKPNRMEAEILSGESDPMAAADRLLAKGVGRVFISLGAGGLYYADGHSAGYMDAPPMRVDSTTGAGDAVTAGIADGMARGLDTAACAQLGVQAATAHLRKQGGTLL